MTTKHALAEKQHSSAEPEPAREVTVPDGAMKETLLRSLLRAYEGVIAQQQLLTLKETELRRKMHSYLTWDEQAEVRPALEGEPIASPAAVDG